MCEHFAAERADVPADVWRLVPGAPDYLTGYGWSLRPHTWHQWYRWLASISLPEAIPVPDFGMDVHVFTDGSCLNQAHPNCRLASWSVVLAGFDTTAGHVVDSGPLPGLMQSSYRAEIFAVIRALQAMRMQTGRVHIWSDCQAVVTRVRRLLRGGEPKPNSAHSDLWKLVFESIRDLSPGQIEITKVAAHQQVGEATSPLEEWCFIHNSSADQAAALAQWMRPPEFWQLCDRHVSAIIACKNFSRAAGTTGFASNQ